MTPPASTRTDRRRGSPLFGRASARALAQLLETLWGSNTGCVSVQALQEFFVAVTKKLARPLPVEDTAARIRELAAWRVFTLTADDIPSAIALHGQAQIGFRGAMIVPAGSESGCDVLWTEDLNDGNLLRGVRIRNPFSGQE